jgi:ubiquinone/menaquinone biosynthesis C-methylase UbiE
MNNNQEFWEELCGTHAFRSLGLNHIDQQSLRIFDDYYWNYYPYLKKYVSNNHLSQNDVLEIGLGFGTVSQFLAENSKSYTGVDYAINPVNLVNQRIKWSSLKNTKSEAIFADAKNLPFQDNSFDFVVSIGCLHHTGDTQKSIDEVFRVLRSGGECIIMLYNKNSYRMKMSYLLYKKDLIFGKTKIKNFDTYIRSLYDADSDGKAAPIIDFYSILELKLMFSKFIDVTFQKENNNIRHLRKSLLNNFSRFFGLDVYIIAKKQ